MIDTFEAGQLFYAEWRRIGDHHRHALGDVQIPCSCENGRVDIHNDGQPHGNEKFRTCPDCAGQGTIWIEGTP